MKKKRIKAFVQIMLAAVLILTSVLPLQAQETSLKLNKTNITMVAGKTYILKLSQATEKIKWSTAKKSIAQVKSIDQTSAKVTAKKTGTTKITAKAGGKKYTCKVKVVSAKLSAKNKTLTTEDSFTLKIKGKNTSKWKSSDTSVAKVNSKGKVTAKKPGKVTITATIGVSQLKCKVTVKASKWDKLLDKYLADEAVNQLVFVKYTGGTKADVMMYDKTDTGWNCVLECQGYVGKKGINKKKEGDKKTPSGVYNLTSGFGIKSDPGTSMPYVKVNKYLYWCADKEHYNQLIDTREVPHKCHGEHLIKFVPHYNYGMFLDYNSSHTYKKGSAIFLHCTGSSKYTAGCIAVSEKNMIKILKNAEEGAKICIYRK